MVLINIAASNPPFKVLQAKAAEELKKRIFGNAASRMIDAAAANSGIDSRYFVVPDADDSSTEKFYSKDGIFIKPDTKTRMSEYEKWSKLLAKQTVEKLLDENKNAAYHINRLITISCTGFFAPGLDHYLINEFNLPPTVKRTNISFMGCAASINGFNSAYEAMSADEAGNTLLVSVELCSLHLQTEASRDNILANLIFADGCAAALFSNAKRGSDEIKLKLISTDSYLFNASDKLMGWKIGNLSFEMVLSSDLPKIILKNAVPQLQNILSSRGLAPDSINHWALHPGGRAILDALQTGLSIPEEKMIPSRSVLRNFGNMSSASILFVLKEILLTQKIRKDDLCCAVAFGPGLVMEVALFKGI